MQQLFQQQLKLMELFTEWFGAPQLTPSQTKLIMSGEALENSITEYHYDRRKLIGYTFFLALK